MEKNKKKKECRAERYSYESIWDGTIHFEDVESYFFWRWQYVKRNKEYKRLVGEHIKNEKKIRDLMGEDYSDVKYNFDWVEDELGFDRPSVCKAYLKESNKFKEKTEEFYLFDSIVKNELYSFEKFEIGFDRFGITGYAFMSSDDIANEMNIKKHIYKLYEDPLCRNYIPTNLEFQDERYMAIRMDTKKIDTKSAHNYLSKNFEIFMKYYPQVIDEYYKNSKKKCIIKEESLSGEEIMIRINKKCKENYLLIQNLLRYDKTKGFIRGTTDMQRTVGIYLWDKVFIDGMSRIDAIRMFRKKYDFYASSNTDTNMYKIINSTNDCIENGTVIKMFQDKKN